MNKTLTHITVSDFRQNVDKVLKQIKKSQEPLIITQRGQSAAILLGVEAYKKSEREKEILHLLAQGEKEISIGEGFDLDTVLAEADSLLSQKPS